MEREILLCKLWQDQNILKEEELRTVSGVSIRVLHPGVYHQHAGPDFSGAKLEIDGVLFCGDVEMHIRASDWLRHHHDRDSAYNAVILHVVADYDCEVCTQSGRPLATLIFPHLELYERYQDQFQMASIPPCDYRLASLPDEVRLQWYSQLLLARLTLRADFIDEARAHCELDWEEAFYRSMARSLGLQINGDPMQQLASQTPLKYLYKVRDARDVLEAILHGQSGLLPDVAAGATTDEYSQQLATEYAYHAQRFSLTPLVRSYWKFLRLRPTSFPSIRISQLSGLLAQGEHLFSQVIEASSLRDLYALFRVSAHPYWDSHYKFAQSSKSNSPKQLGKTTLQVLLLNSALPFRFAFARAQGDENLREETLQFYQEALADDNAIIRSFVEHGVACRNAYESQALLELYKNYCERGRCYLCPAWTNSGQRC